MEFMKFMAYKTVNRKKFIFNFVVTTAISAGRCPRSVPSRATRSSSRPSWSQSRPPWNSTWHSPASNGRRRESSTCYRTTSDSYRSERADFAPRWGLLPLRTYPPFNWGSGENSRFRGDGKWCRYVFSISWRRRWHCQILPGVLERFRKSNNPWYYAAIFNKFTDTGLFRRFPNGYTNQFMGNRLTAFHPS